MANNTLTFIEHRDGTIRKSSLEALSEGARIAAKLGGTAAAVLVGANARSLAEIPAHYGASKIFVVNDPRFSQYAPEGYARGVVEVAKKIDPAAVLFAATAMGKDLAPTAAAILGTGVAVDCTRIDVAGSSLSALRPIYAGKTLATVGFRKSPAVLTLRPNIFAVDGPDPSRRAEVEELSLTASPEDLRTVVRELTLTSGGKIELTESRVIVSGGRGMKGPENFKLIEELAAVLGAAVGASRAVVDAGWRPHAEQVGQTGKTVAPHLYIACGISGAIQHLAGMSSSRIIVAVNKDPDAAIFKVATYGIVGDALEVLPVLTREFQKALA